MDRVRFRFSFGLMVISLWAADLWARSNKKSSEPFYQEHEVRVIQERYFQKRFRLELGIFGGSVVNVPFKNSIAGSGNISFHFSEYLGIEGHFFAAKGLFNYDYRALYSEFEIFPQLLESKMQYGGDIVITPIYGKAISLFRFIVYFDTFFRLGGGMGQLAVIKQALPGSASYLAGQDFLEYHFELPYFNIAVGQKVFLNRHVSINWMLQNSTYLYKRFQIDSASEKILDSYEPDKTQDYFHSLHLMLGTSYFF